MSYQVTGACVIVTTAGPNGSQKITLYPPAMLPGDVPAKEIEHLLSVNLIAKVGGGAEPEQERTETTEPPAPAGDGAVKRPAGNASLEAWQEYAVSQGVDPDEAGKASRDDLKAMFK